MGCRLSKDEQSAIQFQHLNMLVVGYAQSGKTKLLSAIKGQQTDEKHTLDINTINITPSLKLMVFEVSGKAQTTWKSFYPTADIVMFVVDSSQTEEYLSKSRQKLTQIDESLKKSCKFFIVLSKTDKLLFSSNDNQTTRANNEQESLSRKVASIVQKLGLSQLKHQHSWSECSVLTGQGIKELMAKLHSLQMKNNPI